MMMLKVFVENEGILAGKFPFALMDKSKYVQNGWL
jgi:hypothetical protein